MKVRLDILYGMALAYVIGYGDGLAHVIEIAIDTLSE